MPLQIRRGLAADLSSVTPAEGEPLYTTDTKRLYLGDGTTAGGVLIGPSAGGGGSDGTVPLITQAYASTEGYGLGDFQSYSLGSGYVRPVTAQTFGGFVDRAGAMEVGVTSTAIGAIGNISSHTASLGGHTSISGTNYRCAASSQLARNTVTGVVRVPALPSGSNPFEAGVCFTDSVDFAGGAYGTGTMGISVYMTSAQANWMVRYAGGDSEFGNLIYVEYSTGVAKSTAWRTIQIITETVAGATTYTIKIGGTTVHTITRTSLLIAGVDMNYSYFYAPHACIRSVGSGGGGMMAVDHLSILSEVTR